jgi:hypothetical protein
MCWRCVSDSVPYVLGSVVAIKAMGSRVLKGRDDADQPMVEPEAPAPADRDA